MQALFDPVCTLLVRLYRQAGVRYCMRYIFLWNMPALFDFGIEQITLDSVRVKEELIGHAPRESDIH